MWGIVISGTLAAIELETTGNFYIDAVLGLFVSLGFSMIVFGPIMMIVEMKKSISNIEQMLANKR